MDLHSLNPVGFNLTPLDYHNEIFRLKKDIQKQEDELFHVRRELILQREELALQREESALLFEESNTSINRLINTFNERITDLYGEINHIKKHGNHSTEVCRDKIIMRNYFVNDGTHISDVLEM